MIISRGRKYIFVHIPKTGGTSLAQALEDRAMRDDILIGDTPKALRRKKRLKLLSSRGRLWKHATLADIAGVVTPEALDDMFVFTLVRNPWDRLVSYYHWLRAQTFEHPTVTLSKSLTFGAFLHHQEVQKSFRANPAASYTRDVEGRQRCTQFIRLEHFDADAVPLFAHLGFRFKLPHVNASSRVQDFRRYYDDDTRAIVSDICAEDVDRFGYEFAS